MIDKFNFYDVYGYFVPGLALLAVLWLPFGVLRHAWPSADLGSAVFGVAIAYLLGHLIQAIATNAVPSRIHDGNRYPSAVLFDPGSKILPGLQFMIAESIEGKFGLELQPNTKGDPEVDKVRDQASLLVRLLLVRDKGASYSEQFQGMYALSRGVYCALCLACPYWLGWAVGVFRSEWLMVAAMAITVILIAAAAILAYKKLWKAHACCALGVFFCAGLILASRDSLARIQAAELGIAAFAAIPMALSAYGQFKFFADNYAVTIWRDYLAYLSRATKATKTDG